MIKNALLSLAHMLKTHYCRCIPKFLYEVNAYNSKVMKVNNIQVPRYRKNEELLYTLCHDPSYT